MLVPSRLFLLLQIISFRSGHLRRGRFMEVMVTGHGARAGGVAAR